MTQQLAPLKALLSLDEARAEVVKSAGVCLTRAECGSEGLVAMIWGLPSGAGWSSSDALLGARHRGVLEAVADAGHGWVLAEEIEGIIDATRLDKGGVANVDVILSLAGYFEAGM